MLDLSIIILRISFLLIPGIIGKYFFNLLTGKKNDNDFTIFIEIFLISIFSYFFYGLFSDILIKLNIKNNSILIFELLFNEKEKIDFNYVFSDILITTVISIIFSIILIVIYNYNLINKLAQFFKITLRYGSHDLWDHFHRDKINTWICVRDYKTNLIYYGYVDAFSEDKEKRELIMKDVTVFTDIIQKNGNNKLYDLDCIYFSRDNFDFSIEVNNNRKEDTDGSKKTRKNNSRRQQKH